MHMNIQLLGIGSHLHSFADDERHERRQYPRIERRFAVWWVKDLRGSEPVPGVGLEVSGGGLQFLLRRTIGRQCSLAFDIDGRRMRASVDVLQSTEIVFEGQQWQRHRAKFVGLMEADYAFIKGLAQDTAREISVGAHQSYDMLPAAIQERIVAKLVEANRLTPATSPAATHLAAYYAGIEDAGDGNVCHRFFIRSRLDSPAGALVFNTEVFIGDDGSTVELRT
jgi:hypothetical protein